MQAPLKTQIEPGANCSETQVELGANTQTPNPYFPNLDGLRTIACLLVYMQHGFGPLVGSLINELAILSPVRRIFAAGDLGVSFFFVLSGFLITYLILNEIRQTGQINVVAFWVRRCLRIWPLYYFVVVFSIVLYPMMKSFIGYDQYIDIGNPLLYFIFLGNFDVISLGQSHGAMSTNITWSVAIEEQFYFVWPLLLIIVARRAHILIFLATIAASAIFRLYHADNGMVLYFHTLSVISDMAVGGLAAYLSLTRNGFTARISRVSRSTIGLAYAIGIIFVLYSHQVLTGSILVALDRLLCSFFFAFVILEQNYCANSFVKMSNRKFLSCLGKYTYGLYLLHPIAIQFFSRLPRLLHLELEDVVEQSLVGFGGFFLSLLFAYVSYWFYERPFLRIKDSFQWKPCKSA